MSWTPLVPPAQADARTSDLYARIATRSTYTHSLLPQVQLVLGVAMLAHTFAPGTWRWARDGWSRLPAWAQAAVMVASALALRSLALTEAQPFIYFQF